MLLGHAYGNESFFFVWTAQNQVRVDIFNDGGPLLLMRLKLWKIFANFQNLVLEKRGRPGKENELPHFPILKVSISVANDAVASPVRYLDL